MPVSALPIAAVSPGNVLTSTNWNAIVKDNLNKLLNTGHRVLTVAQFAALGAPEGTKGTVAPDEVYLEVDSTNGVMWHLAYESGEPTYKWRFLGGPPLRSGILTAEGLTADTAGADLATVGPSIAAPRGGDYETSWGFKAKKGTTAAAALTTSFIATAAGAAISASDVEHCTHAEDNYDSHSITETLVNLVAGTTYKMRYSLTGSGGGQQIIGNRWMTMRPGRLI